MVNATVARNMLRVLCICCEARLKAQRNSVFLGIRVLRFFLEVRMRRRGDALALYDSPAYLAAFDRVMEE